MKFVILASLIASALAVPAELAPRTGNPYNACPNGLYSNPQCCATDLLGVICLDVQNPSSSPSSGANFREICAKLGQQARCCVAPVAGQAVLCTSPPRG